MGVLPQNAKFGDFHQRLAKDKEPIKRNRIMFSKSLVLYFCFMAGPFVQVGVVPVGYLGVELV